MPQTHQRLLEGPIVKSLLALAMPIALANILQAAYQLIDAFWVGRLGGSAVAAVSVSTPVMFLTIGLGAGLALAGSTLIAQYFGARNQEMVDHVAAQTLLMIVLVSVVLGGLGYLFAPQLLRLMGVAPGRLPGRARLHARVVRRARLQFLLLHVPVDHARRRRSEAAGVHRARHGDPQLRPRPAVHLRLGADPGAGRSWARPLATLAHAESGRVRRARRAAQRPVRRSTSSGATSCRTSPTSSARSSSASPRRSSSRRARSGITVLTFLITSFGTLTVAAYGVGSTILQVVMIPAMGLSMAVSTLVGQNIGAGNIERAEEIGRLGAWMGFSILTGVRRDRVLLRAAARRLLRSRRSRRHRAWCDLPAHHGARRGASSARSSRSRACCAHRATWCRRWC